MHSIYVEKDAGKRSPRWAGAARVWRGHTCWVLGWGRAQPYVFTHTPVTDFAVSDNRRSPSACYVLLAPSAEKVQHPPCCKGEMFLGVPSFNTEQILESKVGAERK